MAKSFQDIMAEARKEIPEASPQQVSELLKNNGKSPVLLDVRESDEWRQGHLEGAIPLPRGFLEIKVETAIPDKNTPIVAYCAGGVRSLLAAKVMREMGYQNVTSMAAIFSCPKSAKTARLNCCKRKS
jgi:adenylyltransferase/sulfurtransferase